MATSPNRSAISYGPGKVTWDSNTLLSNDDIRVVKTVEFFDAAPTSGFGNLSNRIKNREVEITLTPTMWAQALLPYGTLQVGQSIYASTDKPAVLVPRAGTGITVTNAAITRIPSLTLSAVKSMVGPMTLTGIIGNALDTDDPESWWVDSANAAALTGMDLSKVPTGLYTATYGDISTPFFAQEGFTIDSQLTTEDQQIDGLTYDKTLVSLTRTVKCIPVGPALADLMALIGDADHGGEPTAADLVIEGPVNITVKNCQVRSLAGVAGARAKRVGEIEFVQQRTATTGLLDAGITFPA